MAILPAAGRSRRMGRTKTLLPFGGETVLGRVAAALTGGGAELVVVVVAPGADEVGRLARRLGLRVAVNPEPERGMLSSIVIGLEAARASDGTRAGAAPAPILVCPADLPALLPATVAAVLRALQLPGAGLALPLVRDHRDHARRGHPLAIAPDLVSEIPALDPQVGLKQLLERHPDRLREVPLYDLGAIHDVDTPEDYRRLLKTLTDDPKPR